MRGNPVLCDVIHTVDADRLTPILQCTRMQLFCCLQHQPSTNYNILLIYLLSPYLHTLCSVQKLSLSVSVSAKFEVCSFRAIRICHITLSTPPFRKTFKGSCPDCPWEQACPQF